MTTADQATAQPLEDTTAAPETVTEAPIADVTPIATVKGQAIIDIPKDLYIPPDAMKVLLDAFEGPLDFLLYLIRKQNIDILDIPIASVTRQYMEYIDLMQDLSLELAAEYLVMAAILAEIKSRMLLPRVADPENPEEDPRAELVRRLQEYERYKQAAEDLDKLPRLERDNFTVIADDSQIDVARPLPTVNLRELVKALLDVMQRAELNKHHHVKIDALSVREKMTLILDSIQHTPEHCMFTSLFNLKEGRLGVIVTFLATLELLKQGMIEFVQSGAYAPIYLKGKGSASSVEAAAIEVTSVAE